MNFFIRKWCDLEYGNAKTERVLREYRRHVACILHRLPVTLRQFVKDVHVHDGLFRQVAFCPGKGALTIRLRCDDLQVGYYDVNMTLKGVSLSTEDRRQLRMVANRKKTEVLDDEVDITKEGAFEYRFICWPDGEVSIRFQGFSYQKTPVKGREFVAANPRFRVME